MALFGIILVLVFSISSFAWWHSIANSSQIDPLPTLLPFPPRRHGAHALNSILHHVDRIGDDLLPGPEDIASDSLGNLYTGCADGWIKHILPDGRVQNWTSVGGRPLGLVMGLHGELLVCEPSMGLLNVSAGNVRVLSDSACGIAFKFADGLDVAKDGAIYFTDASTKFGYGYSDLDVLESRPNGRLLKYDPATGATTLLLKDLYFPNGVAVSLNQEFLVFCETSKVRCKRYWLKGEKQGKVDIFIDNLPGYPDNIHVTRRGTFWIGLVSARSWLFELILRFAFVKHCFATPRGLEALNAAPLMAKVAEVSEGGEPLRLFEDPNGAAMSFVTCGLEVGDYLYLGGLVNN